MRYLPVNVYRNNRFGDCSANGISVTHEDKLVVPCPEGHVTKETVEEQGYIILAPVKRNIGGSDYVNFKQEGDERWLMMGGSFVYTCDSRFGRLYGTQPIALHDRYEGKR